MSEPDSSSKALSHQNLTAAFRLARLTARRLFGEGDIPERLVATLRIEQIIDQLVLRAGALAYGSWGVEKSALKSILRIAIDEPQSLFRAFDEQYEIRRREVDRVKAAKAAGRYARSNVRAGDLEITFQAIRVVLSAPAELIEDAYRLVDSLAYDSSIGRARQMVAEDLGLDPLNVLDDSAEIDARLRELGGINGNIQASHVSKKRKTFVPINPVDILQLRDKLIGKCLPRHILGKNLARAAIAEQGGHQAEKEILLPFRQIPTAMLKAAADEPASAFDILNDPPNKHDGRLAGMLFESIWYTGLRPVEWLGAVIVIEEYVPAEDGSGKRVQHTQIGTAINQALARYNHQQLPSSLGERATNAILLHIALEDVLATKENYKDDTWVDDRRILLLVRNAKSGPAIAKGLPPNRLIDISRIPIETKKAIFFLCRLRSWYEQSCTELGFPIDADINDSANAPLQRLKDKLFVNLRKKLRSAAKKVVLREGGVTFYDARHDFADRARAEFTRGEIMALMGHSFTRSLESYGRKHRKKKGSSGGGIAVKPDPSAVQQIYEALARNAGIGTADHDNEPSPDEYGEDYDY